MFGNDEDVICKAGGVCGRVSLNGNVVILF